MIWDGEAWAISPETFRLLGKHGFGPPALRPAAVRTSPGRFGGNRGVISIIPIHGVITRRGQLGGTSTEKLTTQFREALSDRSVLAIVFDVDSAGGEVGGTLELADEIFRSRGKKRTIAVSNCEAVAGAFWLASAATELVVTPSGMVGGIGIVAQHEDFTGALEKAGVRTTLIHAGKYKAELDPSRPLNDSARAYLQGMVDTFHDHFIKDVARGRRVQKESVRARFGQGRSVLARDAVALGMADRIATLDQTLSGLVSGRIEEKKQPQSLSVRHRLLELLARSA